MIREGFLDVHVELFDVEKIIVDNHEIVNRLQIQKTSLVEHVKLFINIEKIYMHMTEKGKEK